MVLPDPKYKSPPPSKVWDESEPLDTDPKKLNQMRTSDHMQNPHLYFDLAENNPLPWQKYLDKGAADLGMQMANRSSDFRGPGTLDVSGFYPTMKEGDVIPGQDYFSKEQMRGIGPANIMGGTESNPMSQAIARKYQGMADEHIQGLQQQQKMDLPMAQSQEAKRAGDVFGMQQKIRMENFKEQYAYQQQRAQMYQQWMAAKDAASSAFLASVISTGAAIGGAVIASDERLKKNIKPADDIQKFLNSFNSYSYEYKNPVYGRGVYTGTMAQELERTAIGRGMVINTPNGKMVDYSRGLEVVFACLSQINKRLSKIGVENA